MHTTDTTDRWTEIRAVHREHHFLYQILGGAALVALGILLGAAIFAEDSGYATNLYTEILSIAVTVFILNLLSERREEARRIRDLKAQLVRDVGSQSNEAAKRAIDEIRDRDWLTGEDGLLKRADLRRANLAGANLEDANLQGARLLGADLQHTDLRHTNLQGADLRLVNLQGANLTYANLQNANLSRASLQNANLLNTNLQGASLWHTKLQDANLLGVNLQDAILGGAQMHRARLWLANLHGTSLKRVYLHSAKLEHANLQNASLENTLFDKNTTLPDSTQWAPNTDLTRFTEPNHPNFWRSDHPLSPAYHHGDDAAGE